MMEYQQALGRAMRYCAAAERCAWELRRKFTSWQVSSEDGEAILEHLRREHYLDHRRYAEAFARDRHRFGGWGWRRIEQELRLRQLSSQEVADALQAVQEEFSARDKLSEILERKLRSLPAGIDERKAYERLMRFGLYRGYDYDEVERESRRLLSRDMDD